MFRDVGRRAHHIREHEGGFALESPLQLAGHDLSELDELRECHAVEVELGLLGQLGHLTQCYGIESDCETCLYWR